MEGEPVSFKSHDKDDKEIIESIKKVVKNNPDIDLEGIADEIGLSEEITLNYMEEITPEYVKEVKPNKFRMKKKLDEEV